MGDDVMPQELKDAGSHGDAQAPAVGGDARRLRGGNARFQPVALLMGFAFHLRNCMWPLRGCGGRVVSRLCISVNVVHGWWYIWVMVDSRMIAPEVFKAQRILAGHKQESLARALGCSRSTIRNFERSRVKALYSVRWDDLARELHLAKAAA